MVILLECGGVVGSLITCLNTSSDFWDFVVCMTGEMIPRPPGVDYPGPLR